MKRPRQRFGDRGEYYVAAQFVLMMALAVGPAQVQGLPPLFPQSGLVGVVALALVVLGAGLLLAGGRRLGSNLTPLPYPKAGGALVEAGIYRYIRHPIYGGIFLIAVGWSLRRGGGLTAVYAACLVALLVAKSRREEIWLTVKHPAYAAYRKRTRRFLPFLW